MRFPFFLRVTMISWLEEQTSPMQVGIGVNPNIDFSEVVADPPAATETLHTGVASV